MVRRAAWFAIKAEVRIPVPDILVFDAWKTMYGGRHVACGDPIFIFASGRAGGRGLIARGVVTRREDVPRTTAARQTPRVSITVARTGSNDKALGRAELRGFRGLALDVPEAELDFKLYRQATEKVIGLSDATGIFLDGLFPPDPE